MITDSKLNFLSPNGAPLSIVAAAGAAITLPGIIDLLGGGSGTTVTNYYGNSAVPGQADGMGVGKERPELVVAMAVAATTSDAATLDLCLQGAPDNGSGSPGTWQTYASTGPLTAAQLSPAVNGGFIMRLPWLPPFPENARPRFLQLTGLVPSGLVFTGGSIAYATVTTVRDDLYNRQAAKAYVVSGIAP